MACGVFLPRMDQQEYHHHHHRPDKRGLNLPSLASHHSGGGSTSSCRLRHWETPELQSGDEVNLNYYYYLIFMVFFFFSKIYFLVSFFLFAYLFSLVVGIHLTSFSAKNILMGGLKTTGSFDKKPEIRETLSNK